MRKTFPDFIEGDILGATHANKWNDVGRTVTDLRSNSYQMGDGSGTTGLIPYIQRIVIVVPEEEESDSFSSSSLSSFSSASSKSSVSDESLSDQSSASSSESSSVSGALIPTQVYEVRSLFFDSDDQVWRTNYDDGPYDLDISIHGEAAIVLNGDILVAYFDPQRDAFVPTALPTYREGLLDENLDPADTVLSDPGKASMSVFIKNEEGDLEYSGKRITVVNRLTRINTIVRRTFIGVQFINQEWRPTYADCARSFLVEESSSSASSDS